MSQKEVKPRRGRPSTFDRKKTLTRAMYCYWQHGLYGISINELCKRIQISKPTFYREYTNEDGLLKEVIEYYQQQIVSDLFQSAGQHVSFSQKMNTLLTLLTTKTDYPSGCLLVTMAMIPERLGPNTLTTVRQLEQNVLDFYKSWIVKAQYEGEIKSTLSPHFLAQYIYYQCTTIVVRMSLGEESQTLLKEGQLALSVLYYCP